MKRLVTITLFSMVLAGSTAPAGILFNPDIPSVIAVSQDGTRAAVAFTPENFGKRNLRKLKKGRAPETVKPCGSLAFYMIGESNNEWSAMPSGRREDVAPTGIITIHFIPGTRRLATKTIDGNIQIRNEAGAVEQIIQTGDMRGKPPLFSNQSFHVTPDGSLILSPDGGSDLVLYNATDGRESSRISTGMDRITTVCCDPAGRFLAASDTEGNVGVWDLSGGNPKYRYASKTTRMQQYCSLGFSADGNRVGASYGKGTVIVWSTETGEEVYRKKVNAFSMFLDRMNLLFHPVDPDVMAFQYVQPEDTLYEVYDLKEKKTIQSPNSTLSARNFAFTPDGRYIIMAAWSRHVFGKPELAKMTATQVDLHFVRVKWERFIR